MGIVGKTSAAVLKAAVKLAGDVGIDREQQLTAELDAARRALDAALAGREQAYLEAVDGEDRTAAAEDLVERAGTRLERARRALEAHQRVAARRQDEAARTGREAAWRRAEKLATDRVELAKELAEHLAAAGKLYERLVTAGYAAHESMPTKPAGGASLVLLSEGVLEAAVGVDVAHAALPGPLPVSPSTLGSYPGVVRQAERAVELVKLARSEDA